MKRLKLWLSSGHWSAEAFKMSLLMGVFVGGLFFVRHDLPGLIEDFKEEKARAKRIAKRSEDYRLNQAKIQAAKERLTNERVLYCEKLNHEPGAYLKCLKEVGEER